jgi:hypothetical protein
MSNYPNGSSQPWAIVIADEHGPGLSDPTDSERLPVQYCRVGQEATPLQQALQRAASVAPASQIILTAVEEYRQCWESAACFSRSACAAVDSKFAALAPTGIQAACIWRVPQRLEQLEFATGSRAGPRYV